MTARRGKRASPPLPSAPQLLTVAEVGRRLGMSHDSVRVLILHGDLMAIDVSTGARPRLRIAEDDVVEFVRKRTLPSPGRPERPALRVADEAPRRATS